MTTTFERLSEALRALEAELPEMVRVLPDESDFWLTFCTHVEHLLNGLGREHRDFVRTRIGRMLRSVGLIGPGSAGDADIKGWARRLAQRGHTCFSWLHDAAEFRADIVPDSKRYGSAG